MADTIQKRVRLTAGQWAAVEGIAAARGIQPSQVIADALDLSFRPAALIERAAAALDTIGIERAIVIDKIDLLFRATFGDEVSE